MSVLTEDDIDTAALVANMLADVAGDEAAVLGRLIAMSDDVGIDATRDALTCLAVCMFAKWIAPHAPGASVPFTIPTSNTPTPEGATR